MQANACERRKNPHIMVQLIGSTTRMGRNATIVASESRLHLTQVVLAPILTAGILQRGNLCCPVQGMA